MGDVSGDNPDAYSGANHMTLAEGRANYKKFSVCNPDEISYVRKPKKTELPENNERV